MDAEPIAELAGSGLCLGEGALNRAESLTVEVRIELAHPGRLGDETFIRRLREIGLDLHCVLDLAGAEQLLDVSRAVLKRTLRVLARLGGDRLEALGNRRRSRGGRFQMVLAKLLNFFEVSEHCVLLDGLAPEGLFGQT